MKPKKWFGKWRLGRRIYKDWRYLVKVEFPQIKDELKAAVEANPKLRDFWVKVQKLWQDTEDLL